MKRLILSALFLVSVLAPVIHADPPDDPPTSLSYIEGAPRYTVGMGILLNRPTVGGGQANLVYSIESGALPAGLILGATGNIHGTPLETGDFEPTIRVTNGGGFAETTLGITVRSASPVISYTPNSAGFLLGDGGGLLAPENAGGAALSWSIAPSLSANTGMSFNTTTGRITGPATKVSDPVTYTVTATGFGGAEGQTTVEIATGTAAPTVTYDPSPHVHPVGSPIPDIVKTGATGIITSYSIFPPLPAGLLLNTTTGRISGTPTAAAFLNLYAVTAHGPGGDGVSAVVLQITDLPAPTVGYDPGPYSFPVGSPIADIVKTGATGRITHYSIFPALPAGLLFNTTTGRVNGVPTAVAPMNPYSVIAHGPDGADTAGILLEITAVAPDISYSGSEFAFPTGSEIAPIVAVKGGGPITSWSIDLGNNGQTLEANTGLRFNATTGKITGTPTKASTGIFYTVTAHGLGGTQDNATLLIETSGVAPDISYPDDTPAFPLGSEIAPMVPVKGGGQILSWSIGLGNNGQTLQSNTGLLFNTTTGKITGAPTKVSTGIFYVVTAHGAGGTQDIAVLAITVLPSAPTVSYDPDTHVFPLGSEITPVVPVKGGGPITAWSIDLGGNGQTLEVNTGLRFNTTTGKITGTPTRVSSSIAYIVTAHGVGGVQGTAFLTIRTTAPAATVTYGGAPLVFQVGTPITPVVKQSATGIISSYSVFPALPAGLSLNPTTGAITGTPTSPSAQDFYEITPLGPGGAGSGGLLAITVQAAPAPLISFSQEVVSFPVGSEIVPVSPLKTNIITSWSIGLGDNDQTLEANTGLRFNTTTGKITGTPSKVSPARFYAVVAHGPGGADTAVLEITTTTPAPTVSYEGALFATAGIPMTPFVKTSATGIITHYSIAPPLPAGVSLNTTTGTITGTISIGWLNGYTITAHGPGGTGTAPFTLIAGTSSPVVAFGDTVNPYVFTRGDSVAPFRASNTGGPITQWAIAPDSNGVTLQQGTGLLFNTTTGRISGKATGLTNGVRRYKITAYGYGSAKHEIFLRLSIVAPPGKLAAGDDESFSLRVTGGAAAYTLRLPALDASTERVTVRVSDLSGREVWSRSVDLRTGLRELTWDGKASNGRAVSAGMYIVRASVRKDGKTVQVAEKTAPLGAGF